MKNKQLKTMAMLSVCFMLLVIGVSIISEDNPSHTAQATDSSAAESAYSVIVDGMAKGAVDRDLLNETANAPGYELMSDGTPFVDDAGWKDIKSEMSGGLQLLFPNPPDGAVISVEDDYMKRRMRLVIDNCAPGTYVLDQLHWIAGNTYYYISDIISLAGDVIRSVKVQTSESDNYVNAQCVTVEVEFDTVYVYELHKYDDVCCVDVRVPKDVYKNIIVVDAGHGGIDIGCSTRDNLNIEKEFTLDMVLKLKEMLDNTNIKVYYTRLGDDSLALEERCSLANELKADMLVSVHCNYYPYYWAGGVRGLETLYSSVCKAQKDNSKKLAEDMLDCIVEASGIPKRKVINAKKDLHILRRSKVPAVIVEAGYISDSRDLEYFKKKKKLKTIVDGIYNGIIKSYEDIYGINFE